MVLMKRYLFPCAFAALLFLTTLYHHANSHATPRQDSSDDRVPKRDISRDHTFEELTENAVSRPAFLRSRSQPHDLRRYVQDAEESSNDVGIAFLPRRQDLETKPLRRRNLTASKAAKNKVSELRVKLEVAFQKLPPELGAFLLIALFVLSVACLACGCVMPCFYFYELHLTTSNTATLEYPFGSSSQTPKEMSAHDERWKGSKSLGPSLAEVAQASNMSYLYRYRTAGAVAVKETTDKPESDSSDFSMSAEFEV
ncbi:expressed unknown protein [Seminavis robusta]|uniref:Uncharacterized protein n=1 Tax=Seminavis robusta TaxID=568900 RepID=A0A9N8H522_9STRA|nr:expressed unknown protein [Seminavis robusta]|eukprot:Sro130_g062110.1 n/a (255) ;mRNA; r:104019-104783